MNNAEQVFDKQAAVVKADGKESNATEDATQATMTYKGTTSRGKSDGDLTVAKGGKETNYKTTGESKERYNPYSTKSEGIKGKIRRFLPGGKTGYDGATEHTQRSTATDAGGNTKHYVSTSKEDNTATGSSFLGRIKAEQKNNREFQRSVAFGKGSLSKEKADQLYAKQTGKAQAPQSGAGKMYSSTKKRVGKFFKKENKTTS